MNTEEGYGGTNAAGVMSGVADHASRSISLSLSPALFHILPRMVCSCLLTPRISPFPIINRSRFFSIFGTDLPFFSLSLFPRILFSHRVPAACSSLPYTPSLRDGKEVGRRRKNGK